MDDSTKGMSDSETALSLANEKNRKFLMQLKELTQMNRTITDQNTALTKENTQLKTDLASKITVNEQLVGKVNQFEEDKEIIASLETKIKGLKEQVEGNLLKISKLTVACEEKDRRIDLLAHHKQRQQKSDGWWKDGSDGCGCSDSISVDSELSVSTLLTESSDEPLSEHRYCPEDVTSMYQRLLSEHVMLERVHSETQFHLLQLKSKIRNDKSMIENLTISMREMREQLRKSEINQEELQFRLDEAQLENEQLEFQILEAQVQYEEALVHGHGKKSDVFINNASSRSLQVEEFGKGGHLEVISLGEKSLGDSIRPRKCDSEVQMMLTPSVQTRGEHGSIFDTRNLEFHDGMISSEDLLWKVIEDSGATKGVIEEKSSEYWKELEERMGLNVDDLALVLEFEDSFPADSEEDASVPHLTQNSELLLSDLENGNDALPPPLPKSVPPSEVKRDTNPRDFYDELHLDNDGGLDESIQEKGTEHDDELLSMLPKSSSAESGFDSKSYSVSNATNRNSGELEIQSRNQRNSLLDHNSNSFSAGRENYLNDHEMFKLREQILELEKQLTSSQSERLVVLQSNKELKRDLDQTQDIAEDKENEFKLLQDELEKLRKRDLRVPAEDQQTQTSLDLPKNLRDSTSQTTENGNFDKLEQLLETKERELGAKANEVDQLSCEMREWQIKVALEIEENNKLTKQLESMRRELEAVSKKEVAAKRASEDAAQLIKRLEQQREELSLSVTSLEARLEKMDSYIHERDSLKQKLLELEHNLEIKNDSETSLLQEVIFHKKKVDDLQLSLEEFRGKEFDFETLQTKYEDLGNLTRRLQTAVAPMKARVARLALKCKTKDELMQRLLNELHHLNEAPASLKAEVQRELKMSSTEDYNRPLSPLTISHLDQLHHKILKLDLTLNSDHQLTTKSDQAEFFRIFPESPGNSDAYMSMLNKSLQDIRETMISPVGEITRNFYGQHTNNISVLINSNDTSVINENLKSFSETNSVVHDVSHHSAKFMIEKPVMNESHSTNSSSSSVKVSRHVSNGHFSAEKDHDTFVEEEDSYKAVNTVDVSSTQMLSTGIPESPSDFRVERLVGAGNVLLSWIPPEMNEISRNHGSTVAGYKVFINGKESLFLSGPRSTKVLLKSLNLSRLPLRFSIQTVSENGETSNPVETYLDHALLRKFKAADVIESVTSDELPMSSALSSPSQREVTVHRKMFLAIYDYHPTGQPNSKAVHQEELGFQTGDIIVTYGPMRPDGYFIGKVRGRRGLVPGSFLEELAPFTSQDAAGRSITHRSRNTSSSSNVAHLIGRRSRSVGARLNLTEFRPL